MFVLIAGGFNVSALVAHADSNTLTLAERQVINAQIVMLQEKLAVLQQQLAQIQATQSKQRQLVVYGTAINIDSSYAVTQQGTLSPTPRRVVDQALFNIWNAVVGTSTTVSKVDSWHTFSDPDSYLGGYVETSGLGTDWSVAINRADYDIGKKSSRRALAELYIHEYAHILVFDNPAITTTFEDRFWKPRDVAHSRSLKDLSLNDTIPVVEQYYAVNTSRFVSDYATISVDEDIAETFLFLVIDPPVANDQSIAAQKKRFLQSFPALAHAVSDLRNNLNTLDVK